MRNNVNYEITKWFGWLLTVEMEIDGPIWHKAVKYYSQYSYYTMQTHHMTYLLEKSLILISRSQFHAALQVFSAFHPERRGDTENQNNIPPEELLSSTLTHCPPSLYY